MPSPHPQGGLMRHLRWFGIVLLAGSLTMLSTPSSLLAHWSPGVHSDDSGGLSEPYLLITESDGSISAIDADGVQLIHWPPAGLGQGDTVVGATLLHTGELLRSSRPAEIAGLAPSLALDPQLAGELAVFGPDGALRWSARSIEATRATLNLAIALPQGRVLVGERMQTDAGTRDSLVEFCAPAENQPDCPAQPRHFTLDPANGHLQSLDFDASRDLLVIGLAEPNELRVLVRESDRLRLLQRLGEDHFDGPVQAAWIPYGRPGAGNLLTLERLADGRSRLREICFDASCEFLALRHETSFLGQDLGSPQRLKDGTTRIYDAGANRLLRFDQQLDLIALQPLDATGDQTIEVRANHAGLGKRVAIRATDLCAFNSSPSLGPLDLASGEIGVCSVSGIITLSSSVICRSGAQLTLSGASIQVNSDTLLAEQGCTMTMNIQTGAIGPTDITDAILTNTSGDCVDYIGDYNASVTDIQNNTGFTGSVAISDQTTLCSIASNGIPNHDFNDNTAHFATAVAEQDLGYQVTTDPQPLSSATGLTLEFDNAVFLNGVKLDLLAAACYMVGDEKSGCGDINQPWRLDPMSPNNSFGTDQHNAHTQPDGAYHYHASPEALFDDSGSVASPVIGFAADGFPIFGPWIDDGGNIRKATSSYQLRSGSRTAVSYNGAVWDPGGSYDGTYRDDYEYAQGSGDLDECNGMTRNNVYGYYVTDSYPWVMGCFRGTPDDSFRKTP